MVQLKSNLVITTILIIITAAFISCEKESSEFEEQVLPKNINLDKENDLIHDFANIIAKSMSDEKSRSFIKKEAIKQFDGDFDILFAEVKDKRMSKSNLKSVNKLTYGEYLKSFHTSNNMLKSSTSYESFLDSLINKYPLIQISIPEIRDGSTEDWDDLNYVPLVAVIPDNFDENRTEVIPAYDIDGNITYLDVNSCPEKPVIVIGRNERLIVKKKDGQKTKSASIEYESRCLETYYETDRYEYLMPIDCGDTELGNPSGSDNSGESTYDRDSNRDRDNLSKARFVNKDAYRQVEPWPHGRPEFKVVITYIEKVGTNYQTKTLTKILTKSDWVYRYFFYTELKTKTINVPIITWDKEKIGDSMKYTWIEQDNSDTKEEYSIATSTTFSDDNSDTEDTQSASVKITVSANDDEAGESVVEYKDKTTDEGTEYNTGIVKFWVNQ